MDAVAPLNERAQIGGNNPPADKRSELTSLIKDQLAVASAWLNEVREITTQEQADRAADFKRQCHDLLSRADAQRKAEKAPHDAAAKAVQDFWKPHLSAVDLAKAAVDGKLTAFMLAEQRRRDEAAAAADKAAREAQEAAEREADRAYELSARAERGELAGTGINTMAQLQNAEEARQHAEDMRKRAEDAAGAKARAGGVNTVGGVRRAVGLKSRDVVVLDVPENAPQKVIVEALKKCIPFIEKHGHGGDLRAEIGRLVNAIYRETKGEVAPGCRVTQITKAV